MGINDGRCAKIYAKASSPVGTDFVEHINNISLTLDGKPVDITEFSAAACTNATAFTQKMNTIKEIALTISGFADLVATQQALLYANWLSGTAAYVKVGFGAAGASPAFEFSANVGNIKVDAAPDGMQLVSFDISNLSTVTVT